MQSRKIKYILCFMSSALLLVIAILGPQLLFALQDNYQVEKSWQGQRVSLDIEALNNSYGSMRERFISLADGLAQERNYYVAGTKYEVTEETYALVQQILGQEIFGLLEEWGLTVNPLKFWNENDSHIQECKKYVIYDDSFDEGETSIVVMAWYLNLRITDNFYIKLLTDTKTNALYYIQYVFKSTGKDNIASSLSENEKMWYYAKMPDMLWAYCSYYYGAGVEKAQSYEEYIEVLNGKMKVSDSILQEEYFDSGISVKSKLPYGENDNFLILDMGMRNVQEKKAEAQVYMGILELKELIPELQ